MATALDLLQGTASGQKIQNATTDNLDITSGGSLQNINNSEGSGGSLSLTAEQIAAAQQAASQQRQIDAILSSIGALDTVRNDARSAAQAQYNRNIAGYNAADAADLARYNRDVAQNEGNLASDRQAALLQASQSGKGLRSILGAFGALEGTGSILADRAIANAANVDIGQATDTFNTNATNLFTARQEAERQQRQRRIDAEAALTNDINAAELARLQGQQGAYTDIANLYGLGTSLGADYASKASALYPEIARAGKQEVGSYAKPSELYSSKALDTYKAGVQDLTVGATPTGSATGRPSLQAYAPGARKRDEEVA